MLKHLTLSLFMLSASSTHAMHNSLSLVATLYACIPSLPPLFSWKSTPLQNMRADIKEFKNKLECDTWYSFLPEDKLFLWELEVFTTQEINTNPEKFLQYCYYQEYHHFKTRFSIQMFNDDDPLLNTCKNTLINSYSALGASLLAKNIPYKERFSFARQLTACGFEPTEKDKNIAHLKRCNQIKKKYSTAITLLLGNHKHSTITEIIPDIKKNIIYCMILSEDTAY